MSFSQNLPNIGGENCTVLGLRLMHRLAMSHNWTLKITKNVPKQYNKIFFCLKVTRSLNYCSLSGPHS